MRILLQAVTILVITLLLGCGQPSKTELADVPELLQTGRWTEAQKIVDDLLAVDSLDLKARYGLGVLQEYRGLEWDALISYMEAGRAGGGFPPAMKAFIRMAVKLDYLENGRQMANILVGQYPDDPEAHFLMAEIDMAQNRLDSAGARIKMAADLTDDDLQTLLYQAELDFHSYSDQSINDALVRLSDADFSSVNHYLHLARLYSYLNLDDSVINALQQAVELDDDNYQLKIDLAQAYFDDRRLNRALSLANEVLAKSEEFGNARVVAAYAVRMLGRPMKAEEHFLNFIELNRQSPIPLEKHGDYFDFFNEDSRESFEYQSAFLRAENQIYVDDYILHLFYKTCYSLLDNWDPMGSKEKLDKYTSLDPNSYDMFFLTTNTMLAYPEMQDSARSMVDKKLAEHRDDRRWLEMAAHHYYRVSRPKKAIDLYEEILTFPYPAYETFLGMLKIYQDNKDIESVDNLAANLPLRFQNNRTLIELMRDIYSAGDEIDKAVTYAEMLINESPDYLADVLILAELYNKQQQFDKTKTLLQELAHANPNLAEPPYRLAQFELEHGDIEKVLPLLSKANEIDTTFGSAFELKGMYFLEKNQIDSAMFYFRKTVKLNWRTPLAYYHLGEHLLQQGDSLARAAGLGMAAVRLFGTEDTRGHLFLGRVYLTQKKYKLARQEFHKGVLKFPDNVELQFMLGKSFKLLDKKDEAKEWLTSALDNGLPSPQKEEAQQLLSQL